MELAKKQHYMWEQCNSHLLCLKSWRENNAALGSDKSGSKCSTPEIVQGALTNESLLE